MRGTAGNHFLRKMVIGVFGAAVCRSGTPQEKNRKRFWFGETVTAEKGDMQRKAEIFFGKRRLNKKSLKNEA